MIEASLLGTRQENEGSSDEGRLKNLEFWHETAREAIQFNRPTTSANRPAARVVEPFLAASKNLGEGERRR